VVALLIQAVEQVQALTQVFLEADFLHTLQAEAVLDAEKVHFLLVLVVLVVVGKVLTLLLTLEVQVTQVPIRL
jgi:hypothetical protein